VLHSEEEATHVE
jgi:hypothetical protein